MQNQTQFTISTEEKSQWNSQSQVEQKKKKWYECFTICCQEKEANQPSIQSKDKYQHHKQTKIKQSSISQYQQFNINERSFHQFANFNQKNNSHSYSQFSNKFSIFYHSQYSFEDKNEQTNQYDQILDQITKIAKPKIVQHFPLIIKFQQKQIKTSDEQYCFNSLISDHLTSIQNQAVCFYSSNRLNIKLLNSIINGNNISIILLIEDENSEIENFVEQQEVKLDISFVNCSNLRLNKRVLQKFDEILIIPFYEEEIKSMQQTYLSIKSKTYISNQILTFLKTFNRVKVMIPPGILLEDIISILCIIQEFKIYHSKYLPQSQIVFSITAIFDEEKILIAQIIEFQLHENDRLAFREFCSQELFFNFLRQPKYHLYSGDQQLLRTMMESMDGVQLVETLFCIQELNIQEKLTEKNIQDYCKIFHRTLENNKELQKQFSKIYMKDLQTSSNGQILMAESEQQKSSNIKRSQDKFFSHQSSSNTSDIFSSYQHSEPQEYLEVQNFDHGMFEDESSNSENFKMMINQEISFKAKERKYF